ncbi:MAG TPA: hypothetical protein VIG74_01745, partial [Alphaproteobacteria bacterium]
NSAGDQSGIATKLAAASPASGLAAAWQALREAESDIAGFIDNKVTPKKPIARLPMLAELERRGVEKNAIQDGNPVTVIFNDGSALTLCPEAGLRDPLPAGTYRTGGMNPVLHVDTISSPLL